MKEIAKEREKNERRKQRKKARVKRKRGYGARGCPSPSALS